MRKFQKALLSIGAIGTSAPVLLQTLAKFLKWLGYTTAPEDTMGLYNTIINLPVWLTIQLALTGWLVYFLAPPLWAKYKAKPKAPVIGEGSASPDTWVRDAIFYAVHGRWMGEFEETLNRDVDIDKARLVLRQMRCYARDGHIKIWGRKSEEGGHRRIKTEYWEDHSIDHFSIWKVPEEVVTRGAMMINEAYLTEPLAALDDIKSLASILNDDEIYEGLRVNQRQIENKFPLSKKVPPKPEPIDEISWKVYQKTKAADMYGPQTKSDIINMGVVAILVEARTGHPSIFGSKPHFSELSRIPSDEFKKFHLGEDNRTLLDRSSQPPKIKWENLSVRWDDLQVHLERQKEQRAEHLRKHGEMPS